MTIEERLKKLEKRDENFQNNVWASLILSMEVEGLGIGKRLPFESDAFLQINSISKGVRFSVMTETQRDAITSPQAGLIIYNSTQNLYNQYNGTYWSAVGIPQYTTTERNALTIPSGAHPLIYNTSTNKLNVYTTAWEAITSI